MSLPPDQTSASDCWGQEHGLNVFLCVANLCKFCKTTEQHTDSGRPDGEARHVAACLMSGPQKLRKVRTSYGATPKCLCFCVALPCAPLASGAKRCKSLGKQAQAALPRLSRLEGFGSSQSAEVNDLCSAAQLRLCGGCKYRRILCASELNEVRRRRGARMPRQIPYIVLHLRLVQAASQALKLARSGIGILTFLGCEEHENVESVDECRMLIFSILLLLRTGLSIRDFAVTCLAVDPGLLADVAACFAYLCLLS